MATIAAITGFAGGLVELAAEGEVLDRRFDGGHLWLAFARLSVRAAGGGQPADRGRLIGRDGRSVPILAVKKVAGRLHLAVDATTPIKAGEHVSVEVDAQARLAFSRAHTLTHLVMGSLRQETTGFASRGADIVDGGDGMMLRFDADDLPFAAVERAMARAREAIQADLEVRVLSAKSVDAARLMGPFRIDPDLALRGKIRLIEIDGVDLNPCSGTHVANLGLIGTHFHAGRPVSLGSRRTLELRLAPGKGGGR